jgi:hypothetical protein
MGWIKAYGWRIAVSLVGLALLATRWTDLHKDAFAPSTYEAAAKAMRTLPGISCPSITGPASDTCSWGQWTLTLTPTSGPVRQLCPGPQVYAIFGGDARSIRLTPTVAGTDPPPPTGSSTEYPQLLDTFNFGNGRNWMAC